MSDYAVTNRDLIEKYETAAREIAAREQSTLERIDAIAELPPIAIAPLPGGLAGAVLADPHIAERAHLNWLRKYADYLHDPKPALAYYPDDNDKFADLVKLLGERYRPFGGYVLEEAYALFDGHLSETIRRWGNNESRPSFFLLPPLVIDLRKAALGIAERSIAHLDKVPPLTDAEKRRRFVFVLAITAVTGALALASVLTAHRPPEKDTTPAELRRPMFP